MKAGLFWELSEFFLINIYPYIIIAAFLIFFALIVLNFKEIKKSIKVRKKTLLLLAILLFAGLYLRFIIFAPEISIFSASWELNLAAKEFARNGTLITCAKGTFGQCDVPMTAHHPAGYTTILSIFLLAGSSLEQMLLVQAIVSVLTALILFFLIFSLTKKGFPSLLGSTIFLFSTISYSCASYAGAASAVFNNFFIAVALFLLFYAWKNNTRKTRALALVSIGLVPLFLIENILALLLFAFGIILFWEYNLKKAREDIPPILFIALTALTLFLLIFWIWIDSGNMAVRFTGEKFLNNLADLLVVWFHYFSPFIFFLPITLALMVLDKNVRKTAAFFGAWFLLYNLLFLTFELGANVRYLQITLIPFSVICGIGASLLIQRINRKIKIEAAGVVLVFLIIFLAVYPALSAQPRKSPFNTSEELFEAIDLIEGQENIYVFIATNTTWEAIYGKEGKYFSANFFLKKEDFNREMYFIDTGKCDQELWKNRTSISNSCRVLRENSQLLFEYKGMKIYKIKRDELSREKILKYSYTI